MRTTACVVMLLLLTSIGAAHEKSLHKGKPVEGEVTAVAADRLTLATGSATLVVLLDDKTTFERADRPAARADVKPGDRLSVFGTRLATGELVAREVLIGGAPDEGVSGHTGHGVPDGRER